MEFLTLLIVLGLLQLWGSGGPIQKDRWFYQLSGSLKNLLPSSKLRLLMIVGVPVTVVLFFQALFDSLLFGLLSLVLYIGVLLYSLGRGDYSENIQRYLGCWNHGNFESAYEQALAIGDFKQSDDIVDHFSLHQHVRVAVLYEGFERWFAVAFWFLLLGPAGAIGYRLSYLSGRNASLDEADQKLALRFVHYLDWLPSRLLAMSFAITGDFVKGFNHCWQTAFEKLAVAQFLDQCALAAIGNIEDQQACPLSREQFIEYGKKELLGLQSLLFRSVICWLVVIAIVTVVAG